MTRRRRNEDWPESPISRGAFAAGYTAVFVIVLVALGMLGVTAWAVISLVSWVVSR